MKHCDTPESAILMFIELILLEIVNRSRVFVCLFLHNSSFACVDKLSGGTFLVGLVVVFFFCLPCQEVSVMLQSSVKCCTDLVSKAPHFPFLSSSSAFQSSILLNVLVLTHFVHFLHCESLG